MLGQILIYPETASTLAYEWDVLFWVITAVTGAATILVAVLLIYFSSKYRRKTENDPTPRILGSHRLELFWTVTPLVIFLILFGWGVILYDKHLEYPADAPEIFVVGKQWMWKVQYPGGQREINKLHLQVGQPVKMTFISEDVIHDFGVPAFRSKIDVLPGRYVTTWYHPTQTGEFYLFCDQYCGENHSKMVGTVYVLEPEEYAKWARGEPVDENPAYGSNLRSHTAEYRPLQPGSTYPGFPVDGSLAWEGRKLFLKLQCLDCHNAEEPRAPLLENRYLENIPLAGGGSVIADENYIRESILEPNKKVREGWNVPSIMPSFSGNLAITETLPDGSTVEVLSEEEVLVRLVAYIKALRSGQTPLPTEEFPAPVGAPNEPPTGDE